MCKRAGVDVNILKLHTTYFQKLELRSFHGIPKTPFTNWPLSLRRSFPTALPQHSSKQTSGPLRAPRITVLLLPSRCLQRQKWPCRRTEGRSSRAPPGGGGWGPGSSEREERKQSKGYTYGASRSGSQRYLHPGVSEERKT